MNAKTDIESVNITGAAAEAAKYNEAEEKKLAELSAKVVSRMTPPGELALPPLLEAARQEHSISDGAFTIECLFDRIYVFQLPDQAKPTYGGGLIYMPESVASRNRRGTPRGVIVGAGLQARDLMASHGVELGSIIRFIRLAPFEMVIDYIDGHELTVLVMKVGDLTGCETLRSDIMAGSKAIVQNEHGQHAIEGVKRLNVRTPGDY